MIDRPRLALAASRRTLFAIAACWIPLACGVADVPPLADIEAAVSAGSCGLQEPPTFEDLRAQFAAHRQAFEELREMLEEDYRAAGVVQVSNDFTKLEQDGRWPRPRDSWGISESRWEEYRELFQAVGTCNGIVRATSPQPSVRIIVWVVGIADSVAERGVLFSTTRVQSNRKRDDDFRAVPLADGWFAYGVNDWVGNP